MITRLTVDGFRSLSRFEMIVNPGLNILVGPNGSGKTNVVSFLQLLSYLTTYPLSDAIAKAGGTGAVFQKMGNGQYRKALNASIEGTYTYQPDDRYYLEIRPNNKRRASVTSTMRYKFSFELSASPDLDAIVYQNQTLMAWKSPSVRTKATSPDEPDLSP